jgi:two-component system, sensor histidine kinase PdtaS
MEPVPSTGMERVLGWLPSPGQPLALRFAGATVIMLVIVAGQVIVERATGLPGLSLLLTGVFITAVSYDHGTGFYAGVLAIIAGYFSVAHLPFAPTPAGMVVFALLCFGVAIFGEALRNALQRSMLSARTNEVLLQEVQHRTKNTLAIIDALLTLQAQASRSAEVREALLQAAGRVRIQAEAHRHLTMKEVGRVDAQEYLSEICKLLETTLAGVRPIAIECSAEQTMIDPQKALALGLIANELITNAVKYAFKPGETGTVAVLLDRDENRLLRLRVSDNGSGCPEDAAPGLGTRLISRLVKEHKGSYSRVNREKGCEFVVTLAPAAP